MMKILVVDDDPTILEFIRCILVVADYEVYTAESAAKAEEIMNECKFDLILCDIDLNNGVSGFELLKETRSSGQYARFAFLSGRGHANDIEYAMSLGADDYVRKPIEIESLVAKVYRLTARENPEKKIFAERNLDRWADAQQSIFISKVSEDGMQLILKTPGIVNERLKIQASFFDELGIRSPWFRINSCRAIENQKYLAQVSFIGMSESETTRVRSWMIQHPERTKYSFI
jgi:DNA-binding response OmpR family regulator